MSQSNESRNVTTVGVNCFYLFGFLGLKTEKTESPNILKAEGIKSSIALGFYNHSTGEGWMLHSRSYGAFKEINLDVHMAEIAGSDSSDMSVYVTGSSSFPKNGDNIDGIVKEHHSKERIGIQNLLELYFPNSSRTVKWLDDFREAELTLDTMSGGFYLKEWDAYSAYS